MHFKDTVREAFQTTEGSRLGSKRSLLSGLAGLALMAALIALNYWLFRYLFKTSYLRFYLRQGYLVSLALTILTLIIELDRNSDLISAHPFRYVAACLNLIKVPLQVVLRREAGQAASHEGEAQSSPWDTLLYLARSMMNILDQFFSGFFAIFFILVVSIWLWFVAPLQYFVYLICGAPARIMDKPHKVAAHATDEVLHLEALPEIDYFTKPVRMTSALATAALWVASKMI
ncbi:MAG TPA: hypothetical protein VGB17_09445 [Pyrinomonadaceae bacterium]|jgi:hypothetical protein